MGAHINSSVGYVMIWKFCELSGYTEEAVRKNIHTGVWLENRVWRKAPDDHVMINLKGFNSWVETEAAPEKEDKPKTKSNKKQISRTKLRSPTTENNAARGPGLCLQLFKDAGMKPHHVARLLNISRVTASQWLNNHTKPHSILEGKLKLLLDSVEKAVVDKHLPAPQHYRGRRESAYIYDTIQRYMPTE